MGPDPPGGFAGVDVFFVLSGYLITGLLASELFAGGRIDLAGFSRRVRRIVPAALVTVLGVSVLYAVLLGPAVPDTLPTEAASAAFSYSNILFASRATDYFAADAAQSPFLHFWSLAVEEQFYLVWPSLLLLLAFAERRIPVDRAPAMVGPGRPRGGRRAVPVAGDPQPAGEGLLPAPAAGLGAHRGGRPGVAPAGPEDPAAVDPEAGPGGGRGRGRAGGRLRLRAGA